MPGRSAFRKASTVSRRLVGDRFGALAAVPQSEEEGRGRLGGDGETDDRSRTARPAVKSDVHRAAGLLHAVLDAPCLALAMLSGNPATALKPFTCRGTRKSSRRSGFKCSAVVPWMVASMRPPPRG